jgi:hypothetical protein
MLVRVYELEYRLIGDSEIHRTRIQAPSFKHALEKLIERFGEKITEFHIATGDTASPPKPDSK